MESLSDLFRRDVLRAMVGALLGPLTELVESSVVKCEVCGRPVRPKKDGVIVEYRNLIPEYTETYGFCVRHRPEEWVAIKRQIADGELRFD